MDLIDFSRHEENEINKSLSADLEQEKHKNALLSSLIIEYQKRLAMLESSLPDIVYHLDQEGKITYISDSIRKYGYDPKDLIGHDLLEIVHEEDREKARYKIKERRTGVRKTLSFEIRLICKSSPDISFELLNRWIEIQPVFLVSAEGIYASQEPTGGSFIGTQGLVRDITDRKIAAAELYQISDHLHAVLNAIPGYVAWLSHDGRYIGVNQYLASLLGLTPEYFIGKKLGFSNHLPEVTRMANEFLKSDKTQITDSLEIVVNSKQQAYLFVAQKYLKNKAAVFIGIDISEQKRAQKEISKYKALLKEHIEMRQSELELWRAQKFDTISMMAGGIAHDFNNYLTAIMGCLSLFKNMISMDDQLRRLLFQAENAGVQAKNLTNQLLTFAKNAIPSRKTMSIERVLKECSEFSISGSNVVCECEMAPDLSPIDADENLIRQVFNNIIINSVQSMPAGGVINIIASNAKLSGNQIGTLPEGEYVHVSIIDHGIGISPKYLSRIFDPYFSSKNKKSGLGLSISYSIVKQHDGHIDVESALGTGSTFHVFLPVSKFKSITPAVEVPRIIKGSGRVLLLDDDELVRSVTSLMLERLGYTCTCCATAEETIECYKYALDSGNPFSAVILDLVIPGESNGIEICKKLKEIKYSVPVAITSGYADDPVLSSFKSYGFSGSLVKPYKIEKLSMIVHEMTVHQGTSTDQDQNCTQPCDDSP